MTEKNATLREIGERIEEASRIGVISHRRPDGDAIGSTVALANVLCEIGKEVVAVNADGVPDALEFLPGSGCIATPGEVNRDGAEVDLLLVLDSAGKNRVGDEVWEVFDGSGAMVINMDHHQSNDRFGDLNCVVIESPATGQIVFQLIREMNWPLTDTARDNLYVAISTDTGSFRYPNTTAETYRIGGDLLERGLDVGAVSQKTYENYPARRVFLLRELLEGMELHFDDRVAVMKLTRGTIDRLGVQPGDTEGLIDVIRSIDTVIVAVFFEDMPDGKIRVSVRSKSDTADVAEICGKFGGGGHRRAAGTRMKGPLEEAKDRFLSAIQIVLDGSN